MDITKLKISEIREKLEDKEITCREVVEMHFKNISEVEEDINAFISLDKELALKQADRIDGKIKNGDKLGALAGIVVSLKDNIMTKDFKTTAGSKFLEDFVSPYDASVVKFIREEDGIIIGKNNMDEFAIGSTNETSYFGPVKNPLDHSLVAGGSSGGSAAAVATDEARISLGSDTGGSVRQPASYCGVVGFKPSYGRISRYGLVAMSDSLDQIGIVSKNVEDGIEMYKVIGKKDKNDPSTKDLDLNLDNLKGDIHGVKIGIVEEFKSQNINPKVKEEFEKALEILKDNGAIIEEVSISHIKYALELYRIIACSDASTNLARMDGIRYGYRAEDYSTLDELYINSRTEGLGDEVKRRVLLGTHILSDKVDYYNRALKIRGLLIEEFDNAFKQVDILISPTSPLLPFKLGEDLKPEDHYNEAIFNVPVNLAGLCAISVPASKEKTMVGIQFIGDRFKERAILNAALAYEGLVK